MTTAERGSGADPLAEALVPVLLHRLANATQLLSGVRSLIELDEGLAEGGTEDLARLSDELERLGFALGMLASARGANLLLARREPRALAIAHELTQAALRREGRSLAGEPAGVPAVRPDAGDGWQLPWAAAALWLACGRCLGRGETLAWQIESERRRATLLVLAHPLGSERARLVERLLSFGEELALESRESGEALVFPASWLDQRTFGG